MNISRKNKTCKVSGCKEKVYARLLCTLHYMQARRTGGIEIRKTLNQRRGRPVRCSVADCFNPAIALNLCSKHYARYRQHGDPLITKRHVSTARILPFTSPALLARALGVSRQRAHQLLNPIGHKARARVAKALEAGKLKQPSKCERCGAEGRKLEAHHWDYREPLDVRWLCIGCHKTVHKLSA